MNAVIPRVRWILLAVRGNRGATSFRSIASLPVHAELAMAAEAPSAEVTARGANDHSEDVSHDAAKDGSAPKNNSDAPRSYKRVAALPPLLAPESTANDWFRFLAKPCEYWDHRARKAWRRRRHHARLWEEPPDFTHQHDSSYALWLVSAPPHIERNLAKTQKSSSAATPFQLAITPNDERQLRAMVAASRLRNPANPQAVKGLEAARMSGSGSEGAPPGEGAADHGWLRFVRHPEQYWDVRPHHVAAREDTSTAAGQGHENSGNVSSRAGVADFVHQIDAMDKLSIYSAPGWALKAIRTCSGQVPRKKLPRQHVAGRLATAVAELAEDHDSHEDYRAVKAAGLRKPDHPDLIRRRDGAALWMSAATGRVSGLQTEWELNEEKPLQGGHDNGWYRLLARPWEYNDYRSAKKQRNYPDFVHQYDRTRGLWLESAPLWVLNRVVEMDNASHSASRPLKVKTPLDKAREKWASFLADPSSWEDLRSQKRRGQLSARHPDLVLRKDRRRGLWLNAATTPPEVHKVLTVLSMQQSSPVEAIPIPTLQPAGPSV